MMGPFWAWLNGAKLLYGGPYSNGEGMALRVSCDETRTKDWTSDSESRTSDSKLCRRGGCRSLAPTFPSPTVTIMCGAPAGGGRRALKFDSPAEIATRISRLGYRDGDHPGAFFGRPAGNEPRQIGSLRGGGSGAGGEGGQGVADSSQKRRGKELRSQHPAIVRRPGPRRRGGAARCNCAPVRGGRGGGGYYG